MARHPSFTAARAATVVRGLSWSGLCQTWADSTDALRLTGSGDAAVGLVLLRAALLDEMQRSHPHPFAAWYAAQWGDPAPARRRWWHALGPSAVD